MSDTQKRVKIYPNSQRKDPDTPRQYIPQYQVHGVEPKKMQGAEILGNTIITKAKPLPLDNPRAKRSALRQPYATAVSSPIGKGAVPNVGNNMEHTWSAVDGDIIDDLTGDEMDPNQEMIDNNDMVTEQALGFQNGFVADNFQSSVPQGRVTIETTDDTQDNYQEQRTIAPQLQDTNSEDWGSIMADLSSDVLLLVVSGVPICSGPKEEIESLARDFVFGQHEVCDGNPVPLEDVIVMKRVKVKVGVFLE